MLRELVKDDLKTGHFVLHDELHDSEYDIAISKCKTKAELLHWIRHLLDKNWVTERHIRQLIDHAHKTHGESMNPWTDQ